MSTTGLTVFEGTLHEPNLWLKEMAEALGTDRRENAFAALLELRDLRVAAA